MMLDVIGVFFQMVDKMAPEALKLHFRKSTVLETSEDLLRERTL